MDKRIDWEACEEGEELCDICKERRKEEERRILWAQVICRLDKEYNNSGVVLEASREEESSEVSFN